MIAEVAATTGTGQRYALELRQLWPDVNRALTRLDAIAADPYALDADDVAEQLLHLQYRLHVAGEAVVGLQPPTGAETAHAELADALACARDATADVAEAIADEGLDALRFLLHEWRGALFRVRLARLRLAPPAPRRTPPATDEHGDLARPLVAFLLALTGALAVAGGATLGAWPVWLAGMLAVAGGLLAYRP
jgi:hypothetical protein